MESLLYKLVVKQLGPVLIPLTGIIWLLETFLWRKSRPRDTEAPWWVTYSVVAFPLLILGLIMVVVVQAYGFAAGLLLLIVLTGGVWVLDLLLLRRARGAGANQPWWIEYSISFFPVILIVFVLRSFLVEPFKIPSASMMPTLLIGDFILVNKYAYGIRIPVINRKIIDVGEPRRGDVMVFRWPPDPSLDYIKRVVGVPGDRIEYRDRRLLINGAPVPSRKMDDYLSKERMQYMQRYAEKLDSVEHEILVEEDTPSFIQRMRSFPFQDNCNYNNGGLACTVPPGHYFVMGDNRDNSSDSRVWGFVPDDHIVGRAFFIWLNFNELGRFGSFR